MPGKALTVYTMASLREASEEARVSSGLNVTEEMGDLAVGPEGEASQQVMWVRAFVKAGAQDAVTRRPQSRSVMDIV